MNKSVTAPYPTAVSLFRGLYARVARDLGVGVSYISRIARGERKSEIANKALNRDFGKILAVIVNSPTPAAKRRDGRIKEKVRRKR